MIEWGPKKIVLPYLIDNEENRRTLHNWYISRPKQIQEMIDARPMGTCYVMPNDEKVRGHYTIQSYVEGGTVKILHGSDSFLPGFMVFGVDPKKLSLCGCGKWEPATKAQAETAHEFLEVQKKIKAARENKTS